MGRKKNKKSSQFNGPQDDKVKQCSESEYQHSHEEKRISNNDTFLDKEISIQHVVDTNNTTEGINYPVKEEGTNLEHNEGNKESVHVNQEQSMKAPAIEVDDDSSLHKWIAFIRDNNNKTHEKSKFALSI